MKHMLFIFITLFVAGMAHAAAQNPWMLEDDRFEQEILADDIREEEPAPLPPSAAYSTSNAAYDIPPYTRSFGLSLVPEAAIHKVKIYAAELTTEEELDALAKLVQEHNYVATPEQPAKSTQKRWVNSETAHANVRALENLGRKKLQPTTEPRIEVRRKLTYQLSDD
jgi:hypothetical protein